jgi:hypothetical protein
VVTTARHLSQHGAIQIQSTPSWPICLRPILILYSYLRLCFPSDPFLQVPHPNRCMTLSCHPCLSHSPSITFFLIFHTNNILWAVQIMKLHIMQRPPAPCCLLLLVPKYLLVPCLGTPSAYVCLSLWEVTKHCRYLETCKLVLQSYIMNLLCLSVTAESVKFHAPRISVKLLPTAVFISRDKYYISNTL